MNSLGFVQGKYRSMKGIYFEGINIFLL